MNRNRKKKNEKKNGRNKVLGNKICRRVEGGKESYKVAFAIAFAFGFVIVIVVIANNNEKWQDR